LTRRHFLLLLLTSFAAMPLTERAFAKDGESGSDNGGSDNSGSDNSGSDNSGSDNSGSDNSESDDAGGGGDDDAGNDNSGSGSHDSGKYKDQYGAREAVSAGKAISLEDALKKLQKRHPGKVISVNLGESGGRLLYWFKVKSSGGGVRKVVMDAKTGRIRGLFGFEGS
jgi:uncharacterized membrane protein YkoI